MQPEQENNLQNNKAQKQDFAVSAKKVYSQNFVIEKEIEKKKKAGFGSWGVLFILIMISISCAYGYYLFQTPALSTVIKKENYNQLAFEYNNVFSQNITFIKTNPISKITTKKYDLPVTSNAIGIYELTTGTPILEQNASSKLSFASITKLLSVSTMESLISPSEKIRIEPIGGNISGSRAEIPVGESISYMDAIYGMMLPSGNDIAISVAMKNGYDDFVNEMNDIAKVTGMTNTKLTNPVGLDDPNNHYSSVQDIFKMSRLYLSREQNKLPAYTKEYSIKSLTNPSTKPYKVKNTNDLLMLDEVFGLKTGTTDLAGQSLVLYIKVKGKEYIAILLGSSDRFKEGQKIVDWLKVNG